MSAEVAALEETAANRKSRAPMLSPSEVILLGVLAAVQFTHIVDFMIMMPLGPSLMPRPQLRRWRVGQCF